jgi:putative ABC transport system permease protein
VQPIADITTEIRDMIRDYLGILRIAEAAVLALAVLIAFNSASITVDERAREEATMFAYGLRVRAVLGMLTTETVLMGILGTAIGIGGGFLVLRWMITVLLPRTMPELGMSVVLSPSTMATTMVLGVLAVALAPLSMTRRLRNMDIPSTLRVLE